MKLKKKVLEYLSWKTEKVKQYFSGHMKNSYDQNKHDDNDLFVFVHAKGFVCKPPLLCDFAVRNFIHHFTVYNIKQLD